MTSCFRQYASYYDLLYRDKDYKAEVDYLLSLIFKYSPSAREVLELGCGTGNHSRYFHDAGLSIHGIDQSSEMIDIAIGKSANSPSLLYAVGDARFIHLNRKYDAVVALFHVASYQTTYNDLGSLFSTAHRHLSPGSQFIFDFWYGPAVLTQLPSVRYKRVKSESTTVARVAQPYINTELCTVKVNYDIYATEHQSQNTILFSEEHLLRYYFLIELEYFLGQAGFRVEHSFEWLTTNKITDKSWSGLIVATKV